MSSDDEEDTYQSFAELRQALLPKRSTSSGTETEIMMEPPVQQQHDDDSEHHNNDDVHDHHVDSIDADVHVYHDPNSTSINHSNLDVPSSSSSSSSSSLWIPMLSNFSTSYNVVNISMVLPILERLHPNTTTQDAAACASSLLAGMMLGQVLGGALGDSRLGRIGALRLVMALQVIASLASAGLGEASKNDIFMRLAACRFILGIGCGGVYPLAAVLSAEQGKQDEDTVVATNSHLSNQTGNHLSAEEDTTTDDKADDSVHRVVLTFSTQGVGFVTVPIVAVILLHLSTNLNFVWRFLLGLGALPGIMLLLLQFHSSYQTNNQRRPQLVPTTEDHPIPPQRSVDNAPRRDHHNGDNDCSDQAARDDNDDQEVDSAVANDHMGEPDGIILVQSRGWVQTLFHEPGLGRKVLGTAGTWFLFDVVFYGNTIFQPIVVEAAFGAATSEDDTIDLLRNTAAHSLILTSIALPGYAVAGLIMGKKTCCVTQTPRYVMLQGFAAMAVLYATIGANWTYLRGYPTMLVFLYGMTFFFANYGPNTTTFMLPSLIFEPEHRATWNGVSAAAGKLGALTGATCFQPTAEAVGASAVMMICAVVAIVAYLLTAVTIPKRQAPGPTVAAAAADTDPATLHETQGELV
ncbi:general substrate transporter [Nitzschia inconspicua]|uniref:General substrate transporter n=1 Tax=Nitzschia inconspicua TaxID=303405 RepID=A0A9K3L9G1_9STRA|nr:general substrate transporter [Nitzschia inconspicua]